MSATNQLDDAEKAYDVQVENSTGGGVQQQFIDPVAEKKVIRKLDFHVIPLVMALCTSRPMCRGAMAS